MRKPKVSVCIPTFNFARYLSETIESILKQTYTDYELIIIDDCSTDNTQEVVREYVTRDSRVRYLVNTENIGMVNNWNLCISEAKGEYIKFVFADDVLSSREALERMVAALDSDASIALVGSARYFIDADSEIIQLVSKFKQGVIDGVKVINRCIYEHQNLIGEPSVVMFRKRDATRGFKLNYKQLVDLEMWFSILEQGKFAYIAEPLSSFRVHSGQQTAINNKGLDGVRDNFYLYKDYIDKRYLKIPGFHKKYIKYNNLYVIWKLCRLNVVNKQLAVKEISNHCKFYAFVTMYPFYKMYKPLFKLYLKYQYRK